MRTCKNLVWLMVLVSLAVVSTPANAAVSVVNNGFQSSPTIVTFPPPPPPPTLPPGITLGKEKALAVAWVAVKGGLVKTSYKNGCLTIKSMGSVKVEGKTTIYQPTDATTHLKDHELGHDKLNRFEFERNAVKKVKAKMKGFDKKKFCASTKKAAWAKLRAERKKRFEEAEQAILDQMDALNEAFDSEEYTDHGQNTSPTADSAVASIKARADEIIKKKKAAKAGTAGIPVGPPPVPLDPLLICSDPNAFIQFRKAQAGAIRWNPPKGIWVAPKVNFDALFGMLKVFLKNLTPVGKMDDHKDHFSDSTAVFFNAFDSNEIYMKAGIYQITLEESNDPEYAFMLHGVLDVWGATINNAIGSDWLTVMETAATEDQTCGFWAYFDEPLLDEDGQFIGDDTLVNAKIFFAPVEPEPDTVQNNFDDYANTAELQTEWMPLSATVELTDDTLEGAGAMRVDYNTTIGPAEVFHMFPVPQNWETSDKTHLELWLNTDPNEPDVVGNLTVKINTGGMEYSIKVEINDEPFEGVHTEIAEDGYAAVSIPLQLLSNLGVILNDIHGITLSIEEDPIDGGAISSFFVDEIRLADAPLEPIPTADLDEDFKVTLSDFAILATQWLDGTP